MIQVEEGQLLSPGQSVGGAVHKTCGAHAVPMLSVSCSLSGGLTSCAAR